MTLHELRGFLSSDLAGALDEMHAISKATQCRQFIFSLSLNPPKDAACGIDDLIEAANRAEERLGLKNQPRAIVVHEKVGRRHIHVVWSRIDAGEMKAVEMSFFKNRLSCLSKELYLEHGWNLPDGHKENGWKNPLNFTLAEWQQAKRIGLDPRELKQLFRDAWQHSDGPRSFRAALEDRGYYLAKGDRRGFVAVDVNGEVVSVSRMLGIKTKELEARLGSPDRLPSLEKVNGEIGRSLTGAIRERLVESRREQRREMTPLRWEHRKLVRAQRQERTRLVQHQEEHRTRRNKERMARLNTGWRGVVGLLTGRAFQIRRQNADESWDEYMQYRKERERLFEEQMEERQLSQRRIEELRARQHADRMQLSGQISFLIDLERMSAPSPQSFYRYPEPRLDLP